MMKGAKYRAKERGLPFKITIEQILELIGDGICPALGTPFDINSKRVKNESATLDRFIPKLGYTKQNCAVISSLANKIKSCASAEQVQRVATWMKKQQKGVS
jgi:hypothetical protein